MQLTLWQMPVLINLIRSVLIKAVPRPKSRGTALLHCLCLGFFGLEHGLALAAKPAKPCNSLGMMILVACRPPPWSWSPTPSVSPPDRWAQPRSAASGHPPWLLDLHNGLTLCLSRQDLSGLFRLGLHDLCLLGGVGPQDADCFSPSATRIWLCFWPSA